MRLPLEVAVSSGAAPRNIPHLKAWDKQAKLKSENTAEVLLRNHVNMRLFHVTIYQYESCPTCFYRALRTSFSLVPSY
jgi:hypothetical protein